MKKETYDITGMSCAACSARIEKGISGMEGMQQCSVNLLKNSMTVSYDEAELDSGKIIHQVEDIGYGASLHQTQGSKTTGASGREKNGATDAAAAAAETDRFVSLYDPAVLHFDGTYGWLAAAVVAAGSKKSYDFCIYPVFAGAAGFDCRRTLF